MLWQDVVRLAMQWPEVSESMSYGEPSLKVRTRLLARFRVADDSAVLLDVPGAERDLLIERAPEVYFCEPHYAGHDIVLARLGPAEPDVIERILERRWRNAATKRAIAAFDGRARTASGPR